MSRSILRAAIRAAVARRQNEQGYSQAELARRCGLSPQQLNDYLAGRRNLSEPSLERVLAVLGLTLR